MNIKYTITTKGDSISLLKYWTNIDDIFEFIEVILKFFVLKYGIEVDKVGIILHTKILIEQINFNAFSLKKSLKLNYKLAYCLELAPIDTYFSRFKFIVSKETNHGLINLKSNKD